MRLKLGLSSNRLALKFGKGKLDSKLAMFEFDRNINIFGFNDILELEGQSEKVDLLIGIYRLFYSASGNTTNNSKLTD